MAGSSANLSANITMTDQASAVLRQVRGEIEKTTGSAGKGSQAATGFGGAWAKTAIGLGAAALSVGSLTRVLGESMQAAMDDQKSVTALNQALKNLGLASESANMQAWVDSVQKATGASDDLIRKGLVRIVSATGDVAEAQRGVSLAMDIAAGGYADTESAAKALAAAYQGNTTALQRLRLPIDKATLASKDMKRITEELSQVVGGQAAAAAETYAGKMQRMSTAVDEAKEKLGYGLLDALDSVGQAMGGPDGAVSLIDQLGSSMLKNGQGLATAATYIGRFASAIKDAIPFVSELGDEWNAIAQDTLLMGSLASAGRAIDGITAALDPASEAAARLKSEQEGVTAAYKDANGQWHTFIGGIEQVTAASGAAAETNEDELAPATYAVKTAAERAAEKVSAFKDALDDLNGKTRTAIEAEAAYERAIDQVGKTFDQGVTPALNRAKTGFDLSRESGRKASEALIGLAENAETAAEAAANEGKWKKARRLLEEARTKIAEQAEEWGLSEEAAADYAAQLLSIPKNITTTVTLRKITVGGNMPDLLDGAATGGLITGPGTTTSDSIPVALSNGEFVVKAAAVNKVGLDFMYALNAGMVKGFAKGGKPSPVQYAQNGVIPGPGIQASSFNLPDKWLPDQIMGRFDGSTFQRIQDANADAARAAEEAARAAEAAARAAAEAAERLRQQQQAAIGVARELLVQAAATRDEYAKGVATNAIGFGSITGWSGAEEDWAALTMRAPGTEGAGTPMAGGTGIAGFMASKLARVQQFGDVMRRLQSSGLNESTLRELVAAGPDAGTTIGQALLDAGVGEIGRVNSIQASLEDSSGSTAAFAGNLFYGGAVMDAQGNYARVVGANGGRDETPIQVNLMLDGQTVVTQLLSLKRARGGASLGLA